MPASFLFLIYHTFPRVYIFVGDSTLPRGIVGCSSPAAGYQPGGCRGGIAVSPEITNAKNGFYWYITYYESNAGFTALRQTHTFRRGADFNRQA
jgi:hypothetical protein